MTRDQREDDHYEGPYGQPNGAVQRWASGVGQPAIRGRDVGVTLAAFVDALGEQQFAELRLAVRSRLRRSSDCLTECAKLLVQVERGEVVAAMDARENASIVLWDRMTAEEWRRIVARVEAGLALEGLKGPSVPGR